MKWQMGVTAQHELFEVWINGCRAPDAVAVIDRRRAIVMRHGDAGYERDGLGRIKADLVEGKVRLIQSNPSPSLRASRKRQIVSPDPFDVVICQTEQVLRIGA